MRRDLSSAVRSALWSGRAAGSPVFAVLDAARDPRIAGRVEHSANESACLYAGALSPELAAAAPYLVRLYYGDVLCRSLLEDGWGDAWGVFLQSDEDPGPLRRHLRQLLVVRDQQGRRLAFRWYDPRVLRTYLPTCTREELAAVFGPVRTFAMEGEDPATLLRFSFDGKHLVAEEVHLVPAGAR